MLFYIVAEQVVVVAGIEHLVARSTAIPAYDIGIFSLRIYAEGRQIAWRQRIARGTDGIPLPGTETIPLYKILIVQLAIPPDDIKGTVAG